MFYSPYLKIKIGYPSVYIPLPRKSLVPSRFTNAFAKVNINNIKEILLTATFRHDLFINGTIIFENCTFNGKIVDNYYFEGAY